MSNNLVHAISIYRLTGRKKNTKLFTIETDRHRQRQRLGDREGEGWVGDRVREREMERQTEGDRETLRRKEGQ